MAQQTKRKVLITGGNGFIGSNLAMRLLESDQQAEVFLRQKSGLKRPRGLRAGGRR